GSLRRLMQRGIDERLVDAAIHAGLPNEDDLRDADALRERVAPRIAESYRALEPDGGDVLWAVPADPEHGGHRLIGTTRRAGVSLRATFDAQFLRSPDWTRLRDVAREVPRLRHPPYVGV